MEGLSVGKSMAVTSQAGAPRTTFRLVIMIMTIMMTIPLTSNMIAMIMKIPSEIKVAPRYILLNILLTLFTLLKLLFTVKTLACMPVYIDGEG